MLSRKDPKVLPKVLARNRTQKWCAGIAKRKVIELPIVARSKGQRQWKIERFQERGRQREEQQGKMQRQMLQVWQDRSHVKGLQIQRNEYIRSWRRVGTDRMHRNGKRRFERIGDWSSAVAGKGSGIDSCAAVTVFPKSVADDYPMLDMPGKAKSYRPASGKLLPDLGARKVQVKLRDGSLRYVNPRVANTHRALMAVSEMNDMGHDVFFPRSDRGIKAYTYHESSGTKRRDLSDCRRWTVGRKTSGPLWAREDQTRRANAMSD